MRSRRNNTTLTRKVDKWNPRKVWLIKRYADGHYAINQEVGGRVFLFQLPESNQGADRRDLRLLLKTPRSPAPAGPRRKEHTMKFYYKDQLIRTSKTHAYNWAILTERPDGTYACHGCRVNRSDADSEASRLSRRGVDHIIIAPLEQRGR